MQKHSHDKFEPKRETGRPLLCSYQDVALDNYNARLSSWHARVARKLGGGNLSAGIRAAIEIAAMQHK